MSLRANDAVPAAAADRLQAMVHRLTKARGVRHAIVAVGTGDGEPIWIGAAGAADGGATPEYGSEGHRGRRRIGSSTSC